MHVLHTQCSPSRCAAVTGRYMHVEGHRTQIHLVRPWERNVFQYLKDAGYTTAMFGKNDMFAAESFNQSLTYWIDGADGAVAAANAVKFLSNNPPEPFALFLPTHGSHPPSVLLRKGTGGDVVVTLPPPLRPCRTATPQRTAKGLNLVPRGITAFTTTAPPCTTPQKSKPRHRCDRLAPPTSLGTTKTSFAHATSRPWMTT